MWQTKHASAVPITLGWDLIFGRAVKGISSPGAVVRGYRQHCFGLVWQILYSGLQYEP
jgi:hypothetical protein